MPINREPPSIDELSRCLAARIARDGRRTDMEAPAVVRRSEGRSATAKDPARQARSYRTCWLPADHADLLPPPPDNGAYVPALAAALEDDRNLTDGARRLARKIAAYVHMRNREARAADITVTYLMRALRKSRRTIQRYLRQLERAGDIEVAVIHSRARLCAGLMIKLLAPIMPRHGWQSSMKPDAPRLSQKDRSRYKTTLIPRVLWAIRCTDPIRRAWENIAGPLPGFNSTV
jgi:hypothetical protein